MNRAVLASVGLHGAFIFMAWNGLSYFSENSVIEDAIVNVDVVILADEVLSPIPPRDVPESVRETAIDAPSPIDVSRPDVTHAPQDTGSSQTKPLSPLITEEIDLSTPSEPESPTVSKEVEITENSPISSEPNVAEQKQAEPAKAELKPETTPESEPPKETTQEAKADVPEDFSAMLNQILAETDAADGADGSEVTKDETDPVPAPDAPLGAQFTATEISLLSSHISKCWSPPTGVASAKDLIVDLHMSLSPDGRVVALTVRKNANSAQSKASPEAWRAALDAARRAVLSPECQPLPLPKEKYEAWRQLVVEFDPTRML